MRLLRAHPIVAYFVLAYAGSWILWTPLWLTRNGLGLIPVTLEQGPLQLANAVGIFAGPFLAGLLVSRARGTLRAWFAGIVRAKVRLRWWAVTMLAVPAALAVAYLLLAPAAGTTLSVAALVSALVMGVLYALLGGPLGEEPGWRGVALPLLQDRLHPVSAALVLGVLHCLWHTPLFFFSDWDTPRSNVGDLVGYLLLVVALSIVASWIWNCSGGSTLLAILVHNAVNWVPVAMAMLANRAATSLWPAVVALGVLSIIAIGVTRGRLGVAATASSEGVPDPSDDSDLADPAR